MINTPISRPKRPLTDEEFTYIYSKVPRVTVQLICTTKAGILFTKRAIQPSIGIWHLPGGTVIGETYEQAAHRVAKEELGVDVKLKKMVGVLNYLDSKHTTPYNICLMILAELKSQKITLDEQASEYDFFRTIPSPIEEEVADFFTIHKSDIFD